jgi:hypothetical protein
MKINNNGTFDPTVDFVISVDGEEFKAGFNYLFNYINLD